MPLLNSPPPSAANSAPEKNVGTRRKAQLGPPTLFDGIDTWPNMDDALRGRSRELLAKHGQRDWTFAGGTTATDGQPTFGERSSVAAELLAKTITEASRFRYHDETGIEWAVLISGSTQEYWQGVAIGCAGSVAVLDRRRRTELLQQVAQGIESLTKSGRPLSDELQRSRNRLVQMQGCLRDLDAAVAFLTYLHIGLTCSGPKQQLIARFAAEAAWGDDQFHWPHPWRAAALEGFASLGAIQVQRVRFKKIGWQPEALARQAACMSVNWLDTETLAARMSELLIEFIAEWLGPGKPAAVYAARYGDDLRQYPQGEPL
jgi:hypothetical protein